MSCRDYSRGKGRGFAAWVLAVVGLCAATWALQVISPPKNVGGRPARQNHEPMPPH